MSERTQVFVELFPKTVKKEGKEKKSTDHAELNYNVFRYAGYQKKRTNSAKTKTPASRKEEKGGKGSDFSETTSKGGRDVEVRFRISSKENEASQKIIAHGKLRAGKRRVWEGFSS